MNNTLARLVAQAASVSATETAARRTLASMDLTSLGDDDTEASIRTLCARAVTPVGHVAAVCVYDTFVPIALDALADTPVRVATVCNFPHGHPDIQAAADQARAQAAAGADEIDVVLPYTMYGFGDPGIATALVQAVRVASAGTTLKVIIESGALADPSRIEAASRDAIRGGADFIKTSTGKIPVGATLEAAAIMLSVIKDMQPFTPRPLGFKPAGGLKTVADAAGYLYLADTILGPDWATPETLRFGASGLLNDVLELLGVENGVTGNGGY